MKKEDFTKKVTEIDLLLKTHFDSNTKITYVILLHTESADEELMHQAILHNAQGSRIAGFVLGAIRDLGDSIGR